MTEKPSLFTCIAVGKLAGFLIGLAGVFYLAFFLPESGVRLKIGVLLWYTTIGGIIGMSSVFTWHPVLRIPMRWWFRSFMIGAWMNFVLTLFTHDDMHRLMVLTLGQDSFFASPFWFVLEGAIVGLVIGYFASRAGGEGKQTVENLPSGAE